MIIDTKHAPKAIGPYVQAVSAGNLLFISGCCPFKPEDGTVNGDTIEKQTRQAMDNLKAIIESAGIGMDNIVKTTCFISNMDNFHNLICCTVNISHQINTQPGPVLK